MSFPKDLGGRLMSGWGFAESPLIDGDKLVCGPGGNNGTVAALDNKTGKVLWRSAGLKDAASYSSMIVAEPGGNRQYILLTGKAIAGVAAKDGRLLWYFPKLDFRPAAIPTPTYFDSHVFITNENGAGCDLLKLTSTGDQTKFDKVWSGKSMENHHGGIVLLDGHIYGCSGRCVSRTFWRCVEVETGKIAWEEERKLKAGSVMYADGHLYLYSQDGTAVLLEATTKSWKENGRFKIPRDDQAARNRGLIWTHPVVANGKLYLRDQNLLFCYNVSDGKRAAGE